MSDSTAAAPPTGREKTGPTFALVSAVAGLIGGVLTLVLQTTPPFAGWPPVIGPILYGTGMIAAITLIIVYVIVQPVLAYLVKAPAKEAVRLRIAIFAVAAIGIAILARGQGLGPDTTLETARIFQMVGIAVLIWAGVVVWRQMSPAVAGSR